MLMCVYIKDQDCMLSWNGHWNVSKDLERKSTGEGGSTIRVQVN